MSKFITIGKDLFQTEHIAHVNVAESVYTVKKVNTSSWWLHVKFNKPQKHEGTDPLKMMLWCRDEMSARNEMERIRTLLNGAPEEPKLPQTVVSEIPTMQRCHDKVVQSIKNGTHPLVVVTLDALTVGYDPTDYNTRVAVLISNEATLKFAWYQICLVRDEFRAKGWYVGISNNTEDDIQDVHENYFPMWLLFTHPETTQVQQQQSAACFITPPHPHKRQRSTCEPIEAAHFNGKEQV